MRPPKAKIIARRAEAPSALLPLAFLAVLSALALSGCNTVSGMGEDVSAAGQAVDQTSERTQDKMSGKESSRQGNQAGQY